MRKLQIGVMGSCSDLNYTKELETLAEEVGYEIAKRGSYLLFGAEKDLDSLSSAACRGAKKAGGITIGITYGKSKNVVEDQVDVVIVSGLERGGGRELNLVLSCDAIITINGGSGTLSEIAIAYQASIPIIVMAESGGWSQKLANQYMDDRKRVKAIPARTAKEAVQLAVNSTHESANSK